MDPNLLSRLQSIQLSESKMASRGSTDADMGAAPLADVPLPVLHTPTATTSTNESDLNRRFGLQSRSKGKEVEDDDDHAARIHGYVMSDSDSDIYTSSSDESSDQKMKAFQLPPVPLELYAEKIVKVTTPAVGFREECASVEKQKMQEVKDQGNYHKKKSNKKKKLPVEKSAVMPQEKNAVKKQLPELKKESDQKEKILQAQDRLWTELSRLSLEEENVRENNEMKWTKVLSKKEKKAEKNSKQNSPALGPTKKGVESAVWQPARKNIKGQKLEKPSTNEAIKNCVNREKQSPVKSSKKSPPLNGPQTKDAAANSKPFAAKSRRYGRFKKDKVVSSSTNEEIKNSANRLFFSTFKSSDNSSSPSGSQKHFPVSRRRYKKLKRGQKIEKSSTDEAVKNSRNPDEPVAEENNDFQQPAGRRRNQRKFRKRETVDNVSTKIFGNKQFSAKPKDDKEPSSTGLKIRMDPMKPMIPSFFCKNGLAKRVLVDRTVRRLDKNQEGSQSAPPNGPEPIYESEEDSIEAIVSKKKKRRNKKIIISTCVVRRKRDDDDSNDNNNNSNPVRRRASSESSLPNTSST